MKKSMSNQTILQQQQYKKRYCRLTKYGIKYVDYKDPKFLEQFINPQGKILPRRITGNCKRMQKRVTQAVKRARIVALLPFVTDTNI